MDELMWDLLDQLDDANQDADAQKRSVLSRRLQRMTMPQLKRILTRFAPNRRASTRETAIKYIEAALDSPDRLQDLISELAPFDRQLLEELKRRGGKASGWQIHTSVTLRNLDVAPAESQSVAQPGSRYGYNHYAVAANDLTELGLDGLLVLNRTMDPRLRYGDSDEMVSAEPRLLEQVSDTLPPPVGKLRLDTHPQAELSSRHPAAVVLELLNVLQRTAQEGGLHVTRTGRFAKPFLNRLRKNLPESAAENLELLLRYQSALGFVRPPADDTPKQPWPLDQDTINAYQGLPLQFMHAQMVDASTTVGDSFFLQAWQSTYYRSSDHEQFWTAVLQCLPALPDEPVEVTEAATAIWEQVLSRVFGPADAERSSTREPITAIARLLTHSFPELGLLATGTALTDSGQEIQVIAPAKGHAWHTAARAMVEGASGKRHQDWADAERELEQSGPALLVQPNFEVLVYLDLLTSGSVQALAGASLKRLDAQTATFELDRGSVTYALAGGMDVTALLDQLENHAMHVPDNVRGAIRDWSARRDRLQIHTGTRIIEYPDEAHRDAALAKLTGARALAERFVLLDRDAAEPGLQSDFDHHFGVDPALKVRPDGTILARGSLNLSARAVLQQLTTQESRHTFRISQTALRTHKSGAALHKLLAAQAIGGIPRELDVLLQAWRRQGPTPVIARATIFQHPDAGSWAMNPNLSGFFGAQLSPSSFLVIPGKEDRLRELLSGLGVDFASDWPGGEAAISVAPAEAELQTGLSTRKMRELIEAAIEAGNHLELRYARERTRYSSRSFPTKSRGAVTTSIVIPESIFYSGSTPYLLAKTAKSGADVDIRVGYIEAIGVRAG